MGENPAITSKDYLSLYVTELEDKLENLSMEKNRITGDLKASQDEILFLSIPFSKGWTAYVDGTRQDFMRANIGFMAMEVEQGTHSVVLTYEDPLSTAGIMITILGILVLLCCIWKDNKSSVCKNSSVIVSRRDLK